jgi:hypothetical protein
LLTSTLFLFALSLRVNAQESAFSFLEPITELNEDQNKLLSYVTNLPHSGKVEYIEWKKTNLLDENGNITIFVPNENLLSASNFQVTSGDYANADEYSIYGKNSLGNLAIYVTPKGTGGTIDLDQSSYSMFPLGGNKGLLIKNILGSVESLPCAIPPESELQSQLSFCDDDCGKATVDVFRRTLQRNS